MLDRQRDRLRRKRTELDASLRKRPQKLESAGRRIGRWLGRNMAAEKVFQVHVIAQDEWAVGLQIEEDSDKLDWAAAAHGTYLLRTNGTDLDPLRLWRWYIRLTEIEDALRVGKSDLGWRPVYHRREDRVQAHILLCFLALVLWRCFEQSLSAQNLGDCVRPVIQQMATIHSMDVVLSVKGGRTLRLRLVAQPEKLAADLLARMPLRLPTRPKMIENVVEKNGGR